MKRCTAWFVLMVAVLVVSIVIVGIDTAISVSSASRKLPIYGVNTDDKVIALTFDCAWENSDTEQLLDIMNRVGVKATFFATGDFCERYPEDIKLFAQDGHSIQNHSNKHPHVENIEREKLIADTKKCDEIIEELTGKRPTLYRAPYGEYSDSMLGVFEQELHHKVIQWTADSRDWQGRTAEAMAATVMDKIDNGGIILFHNDTENTPKALEMLLPKLINDGYRFVLVEDMIMWDGYTLDHEGRQSSR